MIITTKFDMHDIVTINDIDVEARVIEINLEGKNLQYLVEYWTHNNELKSVWQYEFQLKKV
jgi:hypothetical protein